MIRLPWLLLLAFGLSACAPSVVHFGGGTAIAIPGEIPRDSQGNPVWSAIKPPPANWQAARPDAPSAPMAEGSKP